MSLEDTARASQVSAITAALAAGLAREHSVGTVAGMTEFGDASPPHLSPTPSVQQSHPPRLSLDRRVSDSIPERPSTAAPENAAPGAHPYAVGSVVAPPAVRVIRPAEDAARPPLEPPAEAPPAYPNDARSPTPPPSGAGGLSGSAVAPVRSLAPTVLSVGALRNNDTGTFTAVSSVVQESFTSPNHPGGVTAQASGSSASGIVGTEPSSAAPAAVIPDQADDAGPTEQLPQSAVPAVAPAEVPDVPTEGQASHGSYVPSPPSGTATNEGAAAESRPSSAVPAMSPDLVASPAPVRPASGPGPSPPETPAGDGESSSSSSCSTTTDDDDDDDVTTVESSDIPDTSPESVRQPAGGRAQGAERRRDRTGSSPMVQAGRTPPNSGAVPPGSSDAAAVLSPTTAATSDTSSTSSEGSTTTSGESSSSSSDSDGDDTTTMTTATTQRRSLNQSGMEGDLTPRGVAVQLFSRETTEDGLTASSPAAPNVGRLPPAVRTAPIPAPPVATIAAPTAEGVGAPAASDLAPPAAVLLGSTATAVAPSTSIDTALPAPSPLLAHPGAAHVQSSLTEPQPSLSGLEASSMSAPQGSLTAAGPQNSQVSLGPQGSVPSLHSVAGSAVLPGAETTAPTAAVDPTTGDVETVKLTVVGCHNYPRKDPYVRVYHPADTESPIGTTKRAKNNPDAVWNATFEICLVPGGGGASRSQVISGAARPAVDDRGSSATGSSAGHAPTQWNTVRIACWDWERFGSETFVADVEIDAAAVAVGPDNGRAVEYQIGSSRGTLEVIVENMTPSVAAAPPAPLAAAEATNPQQQGVQGLVSQFEAGAVPSAADTRADGLRAERAADVDGTAAASRLVTAAHEAEAEAAKAAREAAEAEARADAAAAALRQERAQQQQQAHQDRPLSALSPAPSQTENPLSSFALTEGGVSFHTGISHLPSSPSPAGPTVSAVHATALVSSAVPPKPTEDEVAVIRVAVASVLTPADLERGGLSPSDRAADEVRFSWPDDPDVPVATLRPFASLPATAAPAVLRVPVGRSTDFVVTYVEGLSGAATSTFMSKAPVDFRDTRRQAAPGVHQIDALLHTVPPGHAPQCTVAFVLDEPHVQYPQRGQSMALSAHETHSVNDPASSSDIASFTLDFRRASNRTEDLTERVVGGGAATEEPADLAPRRTDSPLLTPSAGAGGAGLRGFDMVHAAPAAKAKSTPLDLTGARSVQEHDSDGDTAAPSPAVTSQALAKVASDGTGSEFSLASARRSAPGPAVVRAGTGSVPTSGRGPTSAPGAPLAPVPAIPQIPQVPQVPQAPQQLQEGLVSQHPRRSAITPRSGSVVTQIQGHDLSRAQTDAVFGVLSDESAGGPVMPQAMPGPSSAAGERRMSASGQGVIDTAACSKVQVTVVGLILDTGLPELQPLAPIRSPTSAAPPIPSPGEAAAHDGVSPTSVAGTAAPDAATPRGDAPFTQGAGKGKGDHFRLEVFLPLTAATTDACTQWRPIATAFRGPQHRRTSSASGVGAATLYFHETFSIAVPTDRTGAKGLPDVARVVCTRTRPQPGLEAVTVAPELVADAVLDLRRVGAGVEMVVPLSAPRELGVRVSQTAPPIVAEALLVVQGAGRQHPAPAAAVGQYAVPAPPLPTIDVEAGSPGFLSDEHSGAGGPLSAAGLTTHVGSGSRTAETHGLRSITSDRSEVAGGGILGVGAGGNAAFAVTLDPRKAQPERAPSKVVKATDESEANEAAPPKPRRPRPACICSVGAARVSRQAVLTSVHGRGDGHPAEIVASDEGIAQEQALLQATALEVTVAAATPAAIASVQQELREAMKQSKPSPKRPQWQKALSGLGRAASASAAFGFKEDPTKDPRGDLAPQAIAAGPNAAHSVAPTGEVQFSDVISVPGVTATASTTEGNGDALVSDGGAKATHLVIQLRGYSVSAGQVTGERKVIAAAIVPIKGPGEAGVLGSKKEEAGHLTTNLGHAEYHQQQLLLSGIHPSCAAGDFVPSEMPSRQMTFDSTAKGSSAPDAGIMREGQLTSAVDLSQLPSHDLWVLRSSTGAPVASVLLAASVAPPVGVPPPALPLPFGATAAAASDRILRSEASAVVNVAVRKAVASTKSAAITALLVPPSAWSPDADDNDTPSDMTAVFKKAAHIRVTAATGTSAPLRVPKPKSAGPYAAYPHHVLQLAVGPAAKALVFAVDAVLTTTEDVDEPSLGLEEGVGSDGTALVEAEKKKAKKETVVCLGHAELQPHHLVDAGAMWAPVLSEDVTVGHILVQWRAQWASPPPRHHAPQPGLLAGRQLPPGHPLAAAQGTGTPGTVSVAASTGGGLTPHGGDGGFAAPRPRWTSLRLEIVEANSLLTAALGGAMHAYCVAEVLPLGITPECRTAAASGTTAPRWGAVFHMKLDPDKARGVALTVLDDDGFGDDIFVGAQTFHGDSALWRTPKGEGWFPLGPRALHDADDALLRRAKRAALGQVRVRWEFSLGDVEEPAALKTTPDDTLAAVLRSGATEWILKLTSLAAHSLPLLGPALDDENEGDDSTTAEVGFTGPQPTCRARVDVTVDGAQLSTTAAEASQFPMWHRDELRFAIRPTGVPTGDDGDSGEIVGARPVTISAAVVDTAIAGGAAIGGAVLSLAALSEGGLKLHGECSVELGAVPAASRRAGMETSDCGTVPAGGGAGGAESPRAALGGKAPLSTLFDQSRGLDDDAAASSILSSPSDAAAVPGGTEVQELEPPARVLAQLSSLGVLAFRWEIVPLDPHLDPPPLPAPMAWRLPLAPRCTIDVLQAKLTGLPRDAVTAVSIGTLPASIADGGAHVSASGGGRVSSSVGSAGGSLWNIRAAARSMGDGAGPKAQDMVKAFFMQASLQGETKTSRKTFGAQPVFGDRFPLGSTAVDKPLTKAQQDEAAKAAASKPVGQSATAPAFYPPLATGLRHREPVPGTLDDAVLHSDVVFLVQFTRRGVTTVVGTARLFMGGVLGRRGKAWLRLAPPECVGGWETSAAATLGGALPPAAGLIEIAWSHNFVEPPLQHPGLTIGAASDGESDAETPQKEPRSAEAPDADSADPATAALLSATADGTSPARTPRDGATPLRSPRPQDDTITAVDDAALASRVPDAECDTRVLVAVVQARNLILPSPSMDAPHVLVGCGDRTCRTATASPGLHPRFDEAFEFLARRSDATDLRLQLMVSPDGNSNPASATGAGADGPPGLVAVATLPLDSMATAAVAAIDRWAPLLHPLDHLHCFGELCVRVRMLPYDHAEATAASEAAAAQAAAAKRAQAGGTTSTGAGVVTHEDEGDSAPGTPRGRSGSGRIPKVKFGALGRYFGGAAAFAESQRKAEARNESSTPAPLAPHHVAAVQIEVVRCTGLAAPDRVVAAGAAVSTTDAALGGSVTSPSHLRVGSGGGAPSSKRPSTVSAGKASTVAPYGGSFGSIPAAALPSVPTASVHVEWIPETPAVATTPVPAAESPFIGEAHAFVLPAGAAGERALHTAPVLLAVYHVVNASDPQPAVPVESPVAGDTPLFGTFGQSLGATTRWGSDTMAGAVPRGPGTAVSGAAPRRVLLGTARLPPGELLSSTTGTRTLRLTSVTPEGPIDPGLQAILAENISGEVDVTTMLGGTAPGADAPIQCDDDGPHGLEGGSGPAECPSPHMEPLAQRAMLTSGSFEIGDDEAGAPADLHRGLGTVEITWRCVPAMETPPDFASLMSQPRDGAHVMGGSGGSDTADTRPEAALAPYGIASVPRPVPRPLGAHVRVSVSVLKMSVMLNGSAVSAPTSASSSTQLSVARKVAEHLATASNVTAAITLPMWTTTVGATATAPVCELLTQPTSGRRNFVFGDVFDAQVAMHPSVGCVKVFTQASPDQAAVENHSLPPAFAASGLGSTLPMGFAVTPPGAALPGGVDRRLSSPFHGSGDAPSAAAATPTPGFEETLTWRHGPAGDGAAATFMPNATGSVAGGAAAVLCGEFAVRSARVASACSAAAAYADKDGVLHPDGAAKLQGIVDETDVAVDLVIPPAVLSQLAAQLRLPAGSGEAGGGQKSAEEATEVSAAEDVITATLSLSLRIEPDVEAPTMRDRPRPDPLSKVGSGSAVGQDAASVSSAGPAAPQPPSSLEVGAVEVASDAMLRILRSAPAGVQYAPVVVMAVEPPQPRSTSSTTVQAAIGLCQQTRVFAPLPSMATLSARRGTAPSVAAKKFRLADLDTTPCVLPDSRPVRCELLLEQIRAPTDGKRKKDATSAAAAPTPLRLFIGSCVVDLSPMKRGTQRLRNVLWLDLRGERREDVGQLCLSWRVAAQAGAGGPSFFEGDPHSFLVGSSSTQHQSNVYGSMAHPGGAVDRPVPWQQRSFRVVIDAVAVRSAHNGWLQRAAVRFSLRKGVAALARGLGPEGTDQWDSVCSVSVPPFRPESAATVGSDDVAWVARRVAAVVGRPTPVCLRVELLDSPYDAADERSKDAVVSRGEATLVLDLTQAADGVAPGASSGVHAGWVPVLSLDEGAWSQTAAPTQYASSFEVSGQHMAQQASTNGVDPLSPMQPHSVLLSWHLEALTPSEAAMVDRDNAADTGDALSPVASGTAALGNSESFGVGPAPSSSVSLVSPGLSERLVDITTTGTLSLHVTPVRGVGLAPRDETGSSDPYCVLQEGGAGGAMLVTSVCPQTLDPDWMDPAAVHAPPPATALAFTDGTIGNVPSATAAGYSSVSTRNLSSSARTTSGFGVQSSAGFTPTHVDLSAAAQHAHGAPYDGTLKVALHGALARAATKLRTSDDGAKKMSVFAPPSADATAATAAGAAAVHSDDDVDDTKRGFGGVPPLRLRVYDRDEGGADEDDFLGEAPVDLLLDAVRSLPVASDDVLPPLPIQSAPGSKRDSPTLAQGTSAAATSCAALPVVGGARWLVLHPRPGVADDHELVQKYGSLGQVFLEWSLVFTPKGAPQRQRSSGPRIGHASIPSQSHSAAPPTAIGLAAIGRPLPAATVTAGSVVVLGSAGQSHGPPPPYPFGSPVPSVAASMQRGSSVSLNPLPPQLLTPDSGPAVTQSASAAQPRHLTIDINAAFGVLLKIPTATAASAAQESSQPRLSRAMSALTAVPIASPTSTAAGSAAVRPSPRGTTPTPSQQHPSAPPAPVRVFARLAIRGHPTPLMSEPVLVVPRLAHDPALAASTRFAAVTTKDRVTPLVPAVLQERHGGNAAGSGPAGAKVPATFALDLTSADSVVDGAPFRSGLPTAVRFTFAVPDLAALDPSITPAALGAADKTGRVADDDTRSTAAVAGSTVAGLGASPGRARSAASTEPAVLLSLWQVNTDAAGVAFLGQAHITALGPHLQSQFVQSSPTAADASAAANTDTGPGLWLPLEARPDNARDAARALHRDTSRPVSADTGKENTGGLKTFSSEGPSGKAAALARMARDAAVGIGAFGAVQVRVALAPVPQADAGAANQRSTVGNDEESSAEDETTDSDSGDLVSDDAEAGAKVARPAGRRPTLTVTADGDLDDAKAQEAQRQAEKKEKRAAKDKRKAERKASKHRTAARWTLLLIPKAVRRVPVGLMPVCSETKALLPAPRVSSPAVEGEENALSIVPGDVNITVSSAPFTATGALRGAASTSDETGGEPHPRSLVTVLKERRQVSMTTATDLDAPSTLDDLAGQGGGDEDAAPSSAQQALPLKRLREVVWSVVDDAAPPMTLGPLDPLHDTVSIACSLRSSPQCSEPTLVEYASKTPLSLSKLPGRGLGSVSVLLSPSHALPADIVSASALLDDRGAASASKKSPGDGKKSKKKAVKEEPVDSEEKDGIVVEFAFVVSGWTELPEVAAAIDAKERAAEAVAAEVAARAEGQQIARTTAFRQPADMALTAVLPYVEPVIRISSSSMARDDDPRCIGGAPFAPTVGHTTTAARGQLYVLGGVSGTRGYVSSIRCYDARSGVWTTVADETGGTAHVASLFKREGHCAALWNGKIVAFGGFGPHGLDRDLTTLRGLLFARANNTHELLAAPAFDDDGDGGAGHGERHGDPAGTTGDGSAAALGPRSQRRKSELGQMEQEQGQRHRQQESRQWRTIDDLTGLSSVRPRSPGPSTIASTAAHRSTAASTTSGTGSNNQRASRSGKARFSAYLDVTAASGPATRGPSPARGAGPRGVHGVRRGGAPSRRPVSASSVLNSALKKAALSVVTPGGYLDSTVAFDTTTGTWAAMPTSGEGKDFRAGHAGALVRRNAEVAGTDALAVFGGWSVAITEVEEPADWDAGSSRPLNSTLRDTDAMSVMSGASVASRRRLSPRRIKGTDHSTAGDEDEVPVTPVGFRTVEYRRNDVAVLDLLTGTWGMLETSGVLLGNDERSLLRLPPITPSSNDGTALPPRHEHTAGVSMSDPEARFVPCPRSDHSVVAVGGGRFLVLFGGATTSPSDAVLEGPQLLPDGHGAGVASARVLNDTWVLDVFTGQWRLAGLRPRSASAPIAEALRPAARCGHSATAYGSVVLLSGGYCDVGAAAPIPGGGPEDDGTAMWQLCLHTDRWQPVSTIHDPVAACGRKEPLASARARQAKRYSHAWDRGHESEAERTAQRQAQRQAAPIFVRPRYRGGTALMVLSQTHGRPESPPPRHDARAQSSGFTAFAHSVTSRPPSQPGSARNAPAVDTATGSVLIPKLAIPQPPAGPHSHHSQQNRSKSLHSASAAGVETAAPRSMHHGQSAARRDAAPPMVVGEKALVVCIGGVPAGHPSMPNPSLGARRRSPVRVERLPACGATTSISLDVALDPFSSVDVDCSVLADIRDGRPPPRPVTGFDAFGRPTKTATVGDVSKQQLLDEAFEARRLQREAEAAAREAVFRRLSRPFPRGLAAERKAETRERKRLRRVFKQHVEDADARGIPRSAVPRIGSFRTDTTAATPDSVGATRNMTSEEIFQHYLDVQDKRKARRERRQSRCHSVLLGAKFDDDDDDDVEAEHGHDGSSSSEYERLPGGFRRKKTKKLSKEQHEKMVARLTDGDAQRRVRKLMLQEQQQEEEYRRVTGTDKKSLVEKGPPPTAEQVTHRLDRLYQDAVTKKLKKKETKEEALKQWRKQYGTPETFGGHTAGVVRNSGGPVTKGGRTAVGSRLFAPTASSKRKGLKGSTHNTPPLGRGVADDRTGKIPEPPGASKSTPSTNDTLPLDTSVTEIRDAPAAVDGSQANVTALVDESVVVRRAEDLRTVVPM